MADVFSSSVMDTGRPYNATKASFIILLPKLLITVVVLNLVVSGALPQLEMAITGGSLPFLPKNLTLLLVGLGSMLLLKGRFRSSPLLPLLVVLSIYFVCEVLYLYFYKALSFADIRSSLAYFIFLLIAGAASVVPLRINPRHALALLLLLAFACLILSTMQFITNSPIVRTESSNHAFHVLSYRFIDKTRGFSLFANGLDAGIFYSFMGGIATSFCLRRGTRTAGCLLLMLCAFGCYATYTRLTMIDFIVNVIAVFTLSKKKGARFARLLPIFSLCCAVLIIVQGLRTSGGAGRNDLENIASLDQRVQEWGIYGSKFLAGSPADMLFGIGQAPYLPYDVPDRPENASPIPIDNAYLLTLLSSGVCGLVLFGFAYWCFWIYIFKRATSSRGHLFRGIAGIVSTAPFLYAINDPPVQIILLLLLAASMDDEDIAIVATQDHQHWMNNISSGPNSLASSC